MRVQAILLTIFLAVSGQAQSGKLANAKLEIEKLIAASKAEVVGVAVYDTESKQTLLVNERVSLHAASTVK
ncbi:MAG: hypothetical protein L0Z53_18615, partial [Acidobacteriales bacterium]|nr:hypothetical protein [Terriglobales bacterium]